MSANRCTVGFLALWATLCVVLLAFSWSAAPGARATGAEAAAPALVHALTVTSAEGGFRLPSAPVPDVPATDTPIAADAGSDPDASPYRLRTLLRHKAWVAVVPLWPADALRWQLLEPSLRLNPGHAPPSA